MGELLRGLHVSSQSWAWRWLYVASVPWLALVAWGATLGAASVLAYLAAFVGFFLWLALVLSGAYLFLGGLALVGLAGISFLRPGFGGMDSRRSVIGVGLAGLLISAIGVSVAPSSPEPGEGAPVEASVVVPLLQSTPDTTLAAPITTTSVAVSSTTTSSSTTSSSTTTSIPATTTSSTSSTSSTTTTTLAPEPVAFDVVISRVHYDAAGNDNEPENKNDEYFDVTNTGPVAISLSGWRVHDEGIKHTFRFPSGFGLEAGATVRIHTGCGSNDAEHLYWCKGGSAVWNNGGDTVTLIDGTDTVVDTWAY